MAAFKDFPKHFNLVFEGKKTLVTKYHDSSPAMVGPGFEYDENGYGYGLSMDTTKPNYPQTVYNAYKDKLPSSDSPFPGSYTYWPWKHKETIEGFYMLCTCQVEAFGKELTTKAILFFKADNSVPFFVYHNNDEEKTIARFKEIREEQPVL